MTEPKKREYPVKPKLEKKRKSLTIRLRDEVRKELELSASKYGRSLSEELEIRMEVSLSQKPQLVYEWGDDCYRLAAAMATALSRIEDWTGSNWKNDTRTANLFKETLPQIAQNYLDIVHKKPRDVQLGDFDKMSAKQLPDAFAAISGIAPPRRRITPIEIVVADD